MKFRKRVKKSEEEIRETIEKEKFTPKNMKEVGDLKAKVMLSLAVGYPEVEMLNKVRRYGIGNMDIFRLGLNEILNNKAESQNKIKEQQAEFKATRKRLKEIGR